MALLVSSTTRRQLPRQVVPVARTPITAGLVFASMPGVDGGIGLGIGAVPTDIGRTTSPHGVVGSFNGSTSRISLGTGFIGDGHVSIFCIAAKSDGNTASGFAQLLASSYDGTHEPLAFKAAYSGGTPELRLTTYNSGSPEVKVDISSVPSGEWCAMYGRATPTGSAGTWDAGLFRANGALLTASASINGITRSTYPMYVGCGAFGGAWRFYDHPIALAAAWNRRLSDAEIRTLAANPWQLFAPPTRRLYINPAGGDVTVSLTGQAATASAGTLTPATNVALAGSAVSAVLGSLIATPTLALSGASVTASAGTLTSNTSVALSGLSATALTGTVSTGNDVTVALSGVALTASAGTLAPSIAVSLAGMAVTAAAGTVVATPTLALTGVAATGLAGTLSPSTAVALAGAEATAATGAVTIAGDKTVALTGLSMTIEAGTLSVPSTAGGGIPKRKRYVVEIDGRDFHVESIEHAKALLERAREQAPEHAKAEALARIPKPTRRNKAPEPPVIEVAAPRITGSPELAQEIARTQAALSAIYAQAAQEAELAARVQFEERRAKRKRRQEEQWLLDFVQKLP